MKLIIFLVAFAVYLTAVCPTVTVQDSGELITGAATLSIAHPPGYPLYCMLAKIFTVIFPFANIGFRVNIFSSLCTAIALTVLYYVFIELTSKNVISSILAIASVFFLGSVNLLFNQATAAEVYSLNTLLIILGLWLIVKWKKEEQHFALLLIFTAGLSISNHHTTLLTIPIYLYFILRNNSVSRPNIFVLAGLFGIGISLYLYLPLRSLANPAMDWGNPETFTSVLAHILRKQYEGVTGTVRKFGTIIQQITVYMKLLWKEWNILLPIIVFGFIYSFMLLKKFKWLILFLWIVLSFGIIFITNFSPIPFQIHQVTAFFVPSIAIMAIWLFLGLSQITSFLEKIHKILALVLCLFLTIFACFSLYKASKTQDRSGELISYRYGLDLLLSAPHASILVVSGDFPSFPLAYLKLVEGHYPSIEVRDEYGIVFQNIHPEKNKNAIMSGLLGNIYTSSGTAISNWKEVKLFPEALAYRIYPPSSSRNLSKLLRRLSFGRPFQENPDEKNFTGYIISQYYAVAFAEYKFITGKTDEAISMYKKIINDERVSESMLRNIAFLSEQRGLINLAIESYTIAMKKLTWSAKAPLALARIYENKNELDKAIEMYKKALEIEPNNASARKNLGANLYEIGKIEEAISETERAISLNPKDWQLYFNLAVMYKSAGKNSEAEACLQKAKSLK